MSILVNNHNSKYSKTLLDTLKNELSAGTTVNIKLGGFSMWPFIKSGTIAVVKKQNISELKSGDIIVFSSINKLIAHRIIYCNKSKTKIITKGDNKFYNDGYLTATNYYGKINLINNETKSIIPDSKLNSILNFILAKLSYILTPFYRVFFKFIKYSNLG
ncbi:MAG: signal peptidase I [Bacteroidetes bacterium GWA2_30_7]|nr:MAG: signal peptidase I [Bacteroidetes bacterium GWA2_30_7]